MNRSLSIVLPVRNAEDRLAAQVDDLLDVLPELTRQFEVLVVDDGSTDDTTHVADDLSVRYPQVRLLRHSVALGLIETIQTGLAHSEGEVVLVGDDRFGLPSDELVRLWRNRNEDHLLIARRPDGAASSSPKLFTRLLSWTRSTERGSRPTPKLTIIRGRQGSNLRVDQVEQTAPSLLGKIKAFALGE